MARGYCESGQQQINGHQKEIKQLPVFKDLKVRCGLLYEASSCYIFHQHAHVKPFGPKHTVMINISCHVKEEKPSQPQEDVKCAILLGCATKRRQLSEMWATLHCYCMSMHHKGL